MSPYCVKRCKGYKLYKFPDINDDKERHDCWLQRLGVTGNIRKHIFACGKHFSKHMFLGLKLKRNAVPDIFCDLPFVTQPYELHAAPSFPQSEKALEAMSSDSEEEHLKRKRSKVYKAETPRERKLREEKQFLVEKLEKLEMENSSLKAQLVEMANELEQARCAITLPFKEPPSKLLSIPSASPSMLNCLQPISTAVIQTRTLYQQRSKPNQQKQLQQHPQNQMQMPVSVPVELKIKKEIIDEEEFQELKPSLDELVNTAKPTTAEQQ